MNSPQENRSPKRNLSKGKTKTTSEEEYDDQQEQDEIPEECDDQIP